MDGQQTLESTEFSVNHSWVPEMLVLPAQGQALPFPKANHPDPQLPGCENTASPLHPDSTAVI